MYELAQSVVSGVLTGSILGLLGAGFSLTWGVTRVVNIAHTTFAVLGAYMAYWLLQYVQLDPVLSVGVIAPLMFGLGVLLHKGVMQPTVRRTQDLELTSLVLTFGLSTAMEHTMAYVWSPDPRILRVAYTGRSFTWAGMSLPMTHSIGCLLALVAIAALYLFLERTDTGKAVRAVWQNPVGAALCGIDLTRVTSITYGIATASAGVAGVALALTQAFDPATHLSWTIYVYLVAIIGGVGNVVGALRGGLAIGVLIGLSVLVIPFVWSNLLLFGLFIMFLFWKTWSER